MKTQKQKDQQAQENIAAFQAEVAKILSTSDNQGGATACSTDQKNRE